MSLLSPTNLSLLMMDSSQDALSLSLQKAKNRLLSQQTSEGYWWYTLEANETIGSGFIQIMHFIDEVDENIQKGLVKRMLSEQRADGSWTLFHEGPGDLSTTVECYFALRLAGHSPENDALKKAAFFIREKGGLSKIRVFSRIHLALFGIVPWSACPSMPVWLMLLPVGSGASIYEFSSWARACIVPLLLLDAVKPVKKISFDLNELLLEKPEEIRWKLPAAKNFFSPNNLFLFADRILKGLDRLPYHPGKNAAIQRAEEWTREHIARTEDIYPAMGYAILGLKSLGHPNSDSTIQKALNGLKKFQQSYSNKFPTCCEPLSISGEAGSTSGFAGVEPSEGGGAPSELHQQCCISPMWDTPWAGLALLEAGIDSKDPSLLKAARYLISKEIKDFRGDWKHKNPQGTAGGWAFEFQNDYFPDVDDTLVIVNFLKRVGLPAEETNAPLLRGIQWMLSMQSKNGGWGAFDKNNTKGWVNRIPFADHGACQDPPTPDITGRMIECLSQFGYTKDHPVLQKALRFLYQTQEKNGAWKGRWGVNFIHGTWAVFQGLAAAGENFNDSRLQKSISWLKSVQNQDGGWGESCLSDESNDYVPLGHSTASQTAWALLGLIAAGEKKSEAVMRGIHWLIETQKNDGGWEERDHTGTGFPGHFYLRYHGYRHYFPLLALARYAK